MAAINNAKFSSVKRVMYETQADISNAHKIIINTPIQTPTQNRRDR